MNNTIETLNNSLFEQLERLQEAESEKELDMEVKRAKAVAEISKNIIAAGMLSVSANRTLNESGIEIVSNPLIEVNNG